MRALALAAILLLGGCTHETGSIMRDGPAYGSPPAWVSFCSRHPTDPAC